MQDLEPESLGWYPRSTNFCFTSGRLLNLSVPQCPRLWKWRCNTCNTCRILPAMPAPRRVFVVATRTSTSFLLSQSCAAAWLPTALRFAEKQRDLLSLPILPFKFSHQISFLYIKAMTREQGHIVKRSTHTTWCELRVISSRKGGISQFPERHKWGMAWETSEEYIVNSALVVQLSSKLNCPPIHTVSKCALTLNICPRFNSALSQVKMNISSVREKTGHASWEQHFYISLGFYSVAFISMFCFSLFYHRVSACSRLTTNINPVCGVTVKHLDTDVEAH